MKLAIRLANLKDSLSVWQIRNQLRVRRNSLQTAKINWASHKIWYENYLKQQKNKIYALENQSDNSLIGYCRYDFHLNFFRVSIAIDRRWQRQGCGSFLLNQTLGKIVKFHLPVRAEVKKSNRVSQILFEKSRFVRNPAPSDSDIISYVLRAR